MQYLLALLFFIFSNTVRANEQALYEKVFGEQNLEEVTLTLFERGYGPRGDVRAKIRGESLVEVHREDLLNQVTSILTSDAIDVLARMKGDWLNPTQLDSIQLAFDPAEFHLVFSADVKNRQARSIELTNNRGDQFYERAQEPSRFSGALTVQGEHIVSSSKRMIEPGTRVQLDGFTYLNGIVLESEGQYLSEQERPWYRGPTTLVYDHAATMLRARLGDVTTQTIGVLPFRQVGGVSFSRNFSLNPYRSNLPSAAQEFTLSSASRVSTFVNGNLIRTEYLPAGKYELSQIPLNNGVNTIVLEIQDESGATQRYQFQQTSSLQLLYHQEARFDLTIGRPVIEENRLRRYDDQNGELYSGFIQYGVLPSLTAGLYAQKQDHFQLYGSEFNLATPIGLVSAGLAQGENHQRSGLFTSALYQLNRQGRYWYDNFQLSLSYDYRDRDFQSSLQAIGQMIQDQWRIQYSQPLTSYLSANIGAQLNRLYGVDERRKSFDLSLSLRPTPGTTLSVYSSRAWDEFGQRNDQVYAFLSMSFPKGHFMQTTYNSTRQATRVSVSNDRLNRLRTVKAQAAIEKNDQYLEGELDLASSLPYAELGLRGAIRENRFLERERASRLNLRAGTTLAFAMDESGFAAEFSRPLANSFALFAPENYEGPLEVRGATFYAEGARGPFGNTLYPNLVPYRYREVSLESVHLPAGQSFERESFVLIPHYRSGHLIRVRTSGGFAITGRLLSAEGEVLKLSTGQVLTDEGEEPFFTNREGVFFIERVKGREVIMKVQGQEHVFEFDETKTIDGVLDIGDLTLGKNS